jgi:hypothetical protein
MQAREFGAAAHTDTAARGNPGPGSFKSKRPMAVIATPDLDLWAQLGPDHAQAGHSHDPVGRPARPESR